VLQAVADLVMQEAYGLKTTEAQFGDDVLASSTLSVGAKRRTGED
jgi:3-deoxy-D-arabino-heptulosonate 7-phosphate (DAHP) synthase